MEGSNKTDLVDKLHGHGRFDSTRHPARQEGEEIAYLHADIHTPLSGDRGLGREREREREEKKRVTSCMALSVRHGVFQMVF